MQYSGLNTWEYCRCKGPAPSAIKQVTILDVQCSDCPVEVQDEVRELWGDEGFGNDYYYYNWRNTDTQKEAYPVIAEYLESKGIQKCLIHWWW